MNLTQVVNELRDEYKNVSNYTRELGESIAALETLTGTVGRTRTPAITGRNPDVIARTVNSARPLNRPGTIIRPQSHATKRTLSSAGRKAIAAAQKARWAKVKASKLEVVKGKKAA